MKNGVLFALLLLACFSCKTTQPSGNNVYTLSGNNPFWSAEISKTGIVFEELGKDKIAYPYKDGESSGDRTIFLTNKVIDGSKSWLKITLVKKPCTDYLAGSKESPYQVELDRDGIIYYGCGKN